MTPDETIETPSLAPVTLQLPPTIADMERAIVDAAMEYTRPGSKSTFTEIERTCAVLRGAR